MDLNKSYWIDKNSNILYFEQISLLHLHNIIKLIERNYDKPQQHYTYNLAMKIYNYREKLQPIPIYKKPNTIGYSKNGLNYVFKRFIHDNDYDEVINNDIELRYLFDTTIEIGSIK